ncbi:HNH endonuclease [Rhizobium laguerreae]|uniref:HNH endonuclease n=1 Tax=Rhizobium laguerreae TaxID=1076926 RepID=UPI0014785222|nr:HNH endonuclease signature motif containing protein [Rhizobium laguerreae]NNH84469.1 HNH endonuclease [Rhizobium laguerreae]
MTRAWSLLTISGIRQYGGNTGYDDDPEAVYLYDSDVANHRQVGAGDIVFIRSRSEVLGIAEIEHILERIGQKDRLRCPHCRATNIKRRLTKSPPWACKTGHVFEEPVNEPVTVTTYEARYGGSFRRVSSDLTIARLHEAVLRPSDQMSIKELDLAHLEPFLGQDTSIEALLNRCVAEMSVPQDGAKTPPDSAASRIEERRRVLREISLRRGQEQFRERLIKRYGLRCQISGNDFAPAIEAAHIRPYAVSRDNGAGNGLLLRSDLHTLFDLGFIGIDPVTRRVSFNPACLYDGYAAYDGALLLTHGTSGPDVQALTERWNFYLTIKNKGLFV